ncbi:MAG TPA: glycosyltransferase family 4 protein [Pirellulales bacterium]|nr:glycosyltransferase family 4 protein [Pirellulales bacterium]
MNKPRVVLITRRFWPLVGGAEIVMARLAAELHERGLATTLLTARWQRDWPLEIEHHGVRVVRLPNPRGRFWGTVRYMRAVAGWLRAHRDSFDLVYVSMLKHDAYAAAGEGRRGRFPVVLRAEGAGLSGDCHWQLDANCGLRIKRGCLSADAFIAPSPAIERELIAAGYPRPRIHYIANGVAVPAPRDAQAKAQARAALAEIDPALWLDPSAPLAVYTGRLHDMKGLDQLVAAWPAVLRRRPDARLWLVGDGSHRRHLSDLIGDLGLAGRILLTGAFDDVDDVLLAADAFVLPSLEEGMSVALLEAMARGLPVVATNIPANEVVIENGRHGRLVPTEDAPALAAAVLELWDDPQRAVRWGEQAQARVGAEFSLDKMVNDHLVLFERLLSSAAR